MGSLSDGHASRGLGINNVGEVVGTAEVGPKGEQHAFVWRNGQLQDLNDLIARNSGWELREARGINDGGQIVGWGSIRGQEHAFLLVPNTEAQAAQKKSGRKAGPGSVPPGGVTFTLASGGSSTAVTNSPLDDAHVRDGSSTNVNFGSATLMELQTSATAGNNRDVYFKFPIDNAPMPIGSARLRVFTSLAANGSVITTTYSVSDTNWGEGTIVWTNRPALGTALTNATFNVKAGASYDIDVTSFLRSEQNAGRAIITLAFHCTNNTSPLASVSSDENGTAANRPALVLNTNAFPTVSITSPANNAGFPAPTNLAISATASDSDGTVTNVDFYAGAYLIGRDATSPFSFTWTNAPVGTYGLKAVAYDEFGAVGTSAVVNITITTNLVPLEDAHVKSDNVTGNFGLATQMEVQTNGASGPTRDAYLKFDLNGVTNISSAKIRFFAAKSSGGGSVSGTFYSVADTNWGETSITWSNKPPLSNVLSHVSVSGTTLVWYTNDVTSFVQGESGAGRSLITLALHSQTNATTFIKFNSRETNSPPELVITTTNPAPAVTITNPANNAVLVAPASFAVEAAASDDGSITQVEFFTGTTSLGADTDSPYSVTWNNVPSGSYALTARATDAYGLISTSAVVNINVDQRPTVTLTAPADGAYFPVSPTNITLSASAADGDGSVTNVEFFAGAGSLGSDATSPYGFTWNSVGAGSYTLTARVADNLGLSSTSAPVSIVVDADTDGDGVGDHIETLLGRNPLVAGATNDVSGRINFRLFTPLK